MIWMYTDRQGIAAEEQALCGGDAFISFEYQGCRPKTCLGRRPSPRKGLSPLTLFRFALMKAIWAEISMNSDYLLCSKSQSRTASS